MPPFSPFDADMAWRRVGQEADAPKRERKATQLGMPMPEGVTPEPGDVDETSSEQDPQLEIPLTPSQRPRAYVQYGEYYSPVQAAAEKTELTKWIARAAGLLILICFLWIGGRYLFSDNSLVRVSLIELEGVQSLELRVPEPTNIRALRFKGEQQELKLGRAIFNLPSDALQVGKNILAVEVLDAQGVQSTERVVVNLPFRIHPLWDRFRFSDSHLPFLIEAGEGDRLSVEDRELQLSSGEPKQLAVPIAHDPLARELSVRVNYRYEKKGAEPKRGFFVFSGKRAELEVLTPQIAATTIDTKVILEGRVAADARVLIDGVVYPHQGERFSYEWELPFIDVHQKLIEVRSAGHLPQRRRVSVQRVRDLHVWAERYAVRGQPAYRDLVDQKPQWLGARVEVLGMLKTWSFEDVGRSLLVEMDECGQGDACTLRVEYPFNVPVKVGEQVRILGEYDGVVSSQIAADKRNLVHLPRIRAAYILRGSL